MALSDFGQLEIRRAVDAALSSDLFGRSKGLGKLLEFLIEHELTGRSGELKETYIGWAFYNKSLTYDPKIDSSVRVSASRLRTRLQRFYEQHPHEPIVIELPQGSYALRFVRRNVASVNAEPLDLEVAAVSADQLREESGLPCSDNHSILADQVRHREKVDLLQVSASDTGLQRGLLSGTVLTVLVGVLIGFLVLTTLRASKIHKLTVSDTPGRWNVSRFSSLGGEEEFPSLSPGGDHIAFVWRSRFDSHPHIYIQDLHSSEPHRLTDGELEENRPVWSPDGKQIAFIRLISDTEKELDIVPVSGGRSTTIAKLKGRSPWLCEIPRLSWSFDGRFIYTSAGVTPEEPCGVVSVDVGNGTIRQLTKPPAGFIGDLEPTVSHDGSIAFLRNVSEFASDIYLISPSGERLRRVTFDNRDIMGFSWSSDEKGFIVSSRRGDGLSRLWEVSLAEKDPVELTDGTTSASFPSSQINGNKIAFAAYHISTSIHRFVGDRSEDVVKGFSGNSAPQVSPDGKFLVYRSDRTGSAELWLTDLNSQSTSQITTFNGPMVNNPRWSPDGKRVVFECRPKGRSDLCVIRLDTRHDIRLLTQIYTNQLYPSWSADGESIYFSSNDSGQWEIYRLSKGQNAIQITHGGGTRAIESRDGHWLYVSRGGQQDGIYRMEIKREGGNIFFCSPSRLVVPLQSGMTGAWDVTDQGIVYLVRHDKSTSVFLAEDKRFSTRLLTRLKNEIPQGDTVLSADVMRGALLVVERDSSNGEIDLLTQTSQPRSKEALGSYRSPRSAYFSESLALKK